MPEEETKDTEKLDEEVATDLEWADSADSD